MRKKNGIEERIKYIRLLEEGYSARYIHLHYGINEGLISSLWLKYQKEGILALQKKKNIKAEGTLKEAIIKDIEENRLTLVEASVKYNVSVTTLTKWIRIYKEQGFKALYTKRPRGRPRKDMGRPRKKKPEEMTELGKLRYENERLRAENALLKKVRALVEERENRLRQIGRKPSKN